MVPEPKGPVALRLEPRVSRSISFNILIEAVLRAIDLDQQLCTVTDEICHIRPYRHLSADMQPLETMALESVPELALGRRHRTTQPLGGRPLMCIDRCMSRHIPSPLVGEG